MLVAGDTFRAAAIGQLKVWAERSGVPIVSGEQGADAAGLVYEGVKRGTAEGIDVLIVDTAGRLQNKRELMDELSKVRRVLGRSEEHTSELQSLMRISYAVFCLKKKQDKYKKRNDLYRNAKIL